MPLSDKDTLVLQDMEQFKIESESIVNQETPAWIRADEMYDQQFDDVYERSNLYNPSLMFDIVQRVVDDLKLADYVLRIPGADAIEKQVVRDYITQIEQQSGLHSLIRDDDKGALSWSYLGNVILWWGASDKELMKQGIPIHFQIVRLTQAYFPKYSTHLRDYNGNQVADKCLFIFEDPTDKVLAMFPDFADEIEPGKLPFTTSDNDIQDTDLQETTSKKETERGYFYDIDNGIFYIVVGRDRTIVEKYDDNDPKLPNYPFKLNGKNYLPCEHLRAFPTIGDFYSKGLYHKFAKVVMNDARRRNLAHLYAEQNVHPDRFIRMADDRYSQFLNDLSLNRELINQGENSYVQIGDTESIEMGDLRTAPLTGEFERMKNDDIQSITQGGIAIGDVDRPASQTATATQAEEISKTRLADHIVKINAGSSMFLRKIIVDFISRKIKTTNEAPVATNTKVTAEGADIIVTEEVGTITAGQVADFIRENEVFIQEDHSAWDNIGMKLRRIRAGLQFAPGTPTQAKLQNQALESLGFASFAPATQQLNQQPNAGPQQNLNVPEEQIAL